MRSPPTSAKAGSVHNLEWRLFVPLSHFTPHLHPHLRAAGMNTKVQPSGDIGEYVSRGMPAQPAECGCDATGGLNGRLGMAAGLSHDKRRLRCPANCFALLHCVSTGLWALGRARAGVSVLRVLHVSRQPRVVDHPPAPPPPSPCVCNSYINLFKGWSRAQLEDVAAAIDTCE